MSKPLPDYCQRPNFFSTILEARAPLDWAKIAINRSQLTQAPKGDGRPIMMLPGYLASELSMAPLAQYLKFLGYHPYQWGLGFNRGDIDENIERLGTRVHYLYDQADQQAVTLIGWSLGGVFARELARLFPKPVRAVITLGTPIIGGPKYTSVGSFYATLRGLDLDAFEKEVHARNSIGFPQPVTSIYSKSDGIVDWRASIDIYNDQARNIEVSSSHLGLGINPSVWRIIAETLAETA